MGFEDFGLLMCTQPFGPPSLNSHAPQFAYLTLVEDMHYQSGTELADRYAEAVVTDTELIDTRQPRWYWDGEHTDDAEREARKALEAVPKRAPLYEIGVAGQGYFACFPL